MKSKIIRVLLRLSGAVVISLSVEWTSQLVIVLLDQLVSSQQLFFNWRQGWVVLIAKPVAVQLQVVLALLLEQVLL